MQETCDRNLRQKLASLNAALGLDLRVFVFILSSMFASQCNAVDCMETVVSGTVCVMCSARHYTAAIYALNVLHNASVCCSLLDDKCMNGCCMWLTGCVHS